MTKLTQPPRPRWDVSAPGPLEVNKLSNELKELVAKVPHHPLKEILNSDQVSILVGLLLNRGIRDGQGALDFLVPDFSALHPWQGLPDIERAVQRLKLAREKNEKLLIHGDYDADGITATSLLVHFFRHWGVDVEYYIPHRLDDGYGLSMTGVEEGHKKGCTVLITVDCGISNYQEVSQANELGMDVIITDHHLPPQDLPPALAVVNPKRGDSGYPFGELAGVGVAYKLAAALDPESPVLGWCLQLAAVGTVADLVPLHNENRILVFQGLKEINNNPLPGVTALAKVAACSGELDSQNIAFGLAPRLNAAGRMDSAMGAVELLLEMDTEKAHQMALELDQENQNRRQVEEKISTVALDQAQAQVELGARILVLHHEDWHPGVVGIVASRVVERFYRPVLVLCGQGVLTGSARSVEGFDIHAALKAVSNYLVKFGGHPGAAGLSIDEDNLPGFTKEIESYALGQNIDDLLYPQLRLDASLTPQQVTKELAKVQDLLAPFGFGNPEPVFALEGFQVQGVDLVGKTKNHLRLLLEGQDKKVSAIGFGKVALAHGIHKGQPLRLAASVQLNRWNGKVSVQLRFSDIQESPGLIINGVEYVDRRRQGEPWLTALVYSGGKFVVNSMTCGHEILNGRVKKENLIVLQPDKDLEKVYNLKADNYCFMEPGWSFGQWRHFLHHIPRNSRVFVFGPKDSGQLLLPNINLLRQFYASWRQKGLMDQEQLLELLPQDLADMVLLKRILRIFQEAGLAQFQEKWVLEPVAGKVDLEKTPAWSQYQKELAEYQGWLDTFSNRSLEELVSN